MVVMDRSVGSYFFFFNDTPPTEIYPLPLPAAFPISALAPEPLTAAFDADYLWRTTRHRRVAIKQLLMNSRLVVGVGNIYASEALFRARIRPQRRDRKSTRLNSSHLVISYAVFCLKKK